MTATTTTTAATCPPWCSNDHEREPDHHYGIVAELNDSDLLLSQLPGEGFRATLVSPDGQAELTAGDVARLGRVFTRLTAALVAAG